MLNLGKVVVWAAGSVTLLSWAESQSDWMQDMTVWVWVIGTIALVMKALFDYLDGE